MCQTPCEPERTPSDLPESTQRGPETRAKAEALADAGRRIVWAQPPAITDLQQWIDLNA